MIRTRSYTGDARQGSIVVRIVRSAGDIVGFIREVEEPVDEVWRLVRNKLAVAPDAPVYVELEAGIEWQAEWGALDDPAHPEGTPDEG